MSTLVPETAAPPAPPGSPVRPAPLASRIIDTFFTPTRVFEHDGRQLVQADLPMP